MKAAVAASHLLNSAPKAVAYVLAFAESDGSCSVFIDGSAIVQAGLVDLLGTAVSRSLESIVDETEESDPDEPDPDEEGVQA